MKKSLISQLVLAMFLLAAGPALLAQADSLADVRLRSLTDSSTHDFARYRGTPVLLMFFQPECNWCYKQVQALNQIHGACGEKIQPVGVGVRGNRRELQSAIRRTRPEFPTYEASGELLALMGREPATPTTMIVDSALQPTGSMLGYFPIEELRKTTKGLTGDACR